MAANNAREFRNAILTADSKKVQELIASGVSADTQVDKEHPLIWLLSMEGEEVRDYLSSEKGSEELAKQVPTGVAYRAAALSTTKVLINNDVKLFDISHEDGEPENYVVEKLMLSSNKRAVAELALATIERTINQGVGPYEFFSESFYKTAFEKYKQQDNKERYLDSLDYLMESMMQTHNDVGMRLLEPSNAKDRTIASKYKKSGNTFWTEEFPDVTDEEIVENMLKKNLGNVPDDDRYKALHGAPKTMIGDDISLSKMVPWQPKTDGDGDGEGEREEAPKVAMRLYIMPHESPEDVLADLDTLIGLKKEKQDFLKWAVQVMKRDEEDPEERIGYSEALLGNPGTGKTTLFRLKARFLHSLEMVGDVYGEVTAADLIAKYVGQTRPKTREALNAADILFIDEAYGLYDEPGKYNYGKEAVDEIVAYTENNRGKPIFFAGYEGDMQKLFSMNDGLQSRVRTIGIVEDYAIEELGEMFDKQVKVRGYKGIEPEAREEYLSGLREYKKQMGARKFANAREVRNSMDDLFGVVKSRIYGLNNMPEKFNLVEQFRKVSSALVVKKKDITITIDDVKALKLRDKSKAIISTEKKVGFGQG